MHGYLGEDGNLMSAHFENDQYNVLLEIKSLLREIADGQKYPRKRSSAEVSDAKDSGWCGQTQPHAPHEHSRNAFNPYHTTKQCWGHL